MNEREDTGEASDLDPVARRITEDDRRRSGAFLRDYLARHRIDPTPAAQSAEDDS